MASEDSQSKFAIHAACRDGQSESLIPNEDDCHIHDTVQRAANNPFKANAVEALLNV